MGRRPALDPRLRAFARRQHDRGVPMSAIADELGVSKSAVHRALSGPSVSGGSATAEAAPSVAPPAAVPATLEGPPTPRPAVPAQTRTAGRPVSDPAEYEARARGAREAAEQLARMHNPHPIRDDWPGR